MKNLLFLLCFPCMHAFAQPAVYTTGNSHSHNDYQQSSPFYYAYNLEYGSIEVDVYLHENELYVARSLKDVVPGRTFENLYLVPLAGMIEKNGGNAYADANAKLILMLDVKTDPSSSLNKVMDLCMKYPVLIRCRSLTIMVTGNKPPNNTYSTYPTFIWFDGLLSNNYSKDALSRIAVMGDNFINYSKWNGHEPLLPADLERLKKVIDKGHALGKKVRLWNTPDFIEGWQKLIELGVDYINTDSIKALAEFLKTNGVRKTE